ncbi:MAG: hypothetical protein ACPLZF_00360 [Nitrososphaeria archaeon]
MEPATKILEITENIQQLFNRKRGLVSEFNRLKSRLEELSENIKFNKRKLNDLFLKREELDKRFNELVDEKKKLIEEKNEIRSALNKKLSSFRESGKKVSLEEITNLEKRLESIEWKLQTEPKAKGMELKYAEEADRLRRELAKKKKALETDNEIKRLKDELEAHDRKIDEINNQIDEVKKNIDGLKNEIRQVKEVLSTYINQEKEYYDNITLLQSEIEKVQSEINKLSAQKKEVAYKIREKENAAYNRLLAKRKQEVKEEIRKKLERGESLTFQELQLLYEDENE